MKAIVKKADIEDFIIDNKGIKSNGSKDNIMLLIMGLMLGMKDDIKFDNYLAHKLTTCIGVIQGELEFKDIIFISGLFDYELTYEDEELKLFIDGKLVMDNISNLIIYHLFLETLMQGYYGKIKVCEELLEHFLTSIVKENVNINKYTKFLEEEVNRWANL